MSVVTHWLRTSQVDPYTFPGLPALHLRCTALHQQSFYYMQVRPRCDRQRPVLSCQFYRFDFEWCMTCRCSDVLFGSQHHKFIIFSLLGDGRERTDGLQSQLPRCVDSVFLLVGLLLSTFMSPLYVCSRPVSKPCLPSLLFRLILPALTVVWTTCTCTVVWTTCRCFPGHAVHCSVHNIKFQYL